MEKIDYGCYDSVENTAVRWLAWNLDRKGQIGFEPIHKEDYKSLWIICVARNLHMYVDRPIYVKCSFLDFLYLKYIKKFKFIKFYRARKCPNVYLINVAAFAESVTTACGTTVETVGKIYDAYYRR